MPVHVATWGHGVAAFAVSLLVGGLATHVGATALDRGRDVDHAVLTALLATIAWAFLAAVPLVGAVLGLASWIAIIRWRYPVGWLRAVGVGVVAWMAAVVVIAALGLVGVHVGGILGVPGA